MNLVGNIVNDSNSVYRISERVSKNITLGNWRKFLGKHRINTEYKNSKYYANKDIVSFINDKVVEGTIESKDLNEFLPKYLSFGRHKSVFLYSFDKEFNNSKVNILSLLNNKFNINSLDYNESARVIYYYKEEEEQDIVYSKILKESEEKILRLRLIITQKVRYNERNKVTNKFEEKFEHSYFPIDIDFEKRQFIIKAINKEYINIKKYKPQNLAKSIAQLIANILNLKFVICRNTNQELLYKMSKKLLDDIIREKGKAGLEELDSEILKLSQETRSKISRKLNIDEKNKAISIENISYEIRSVIENIVLPLILIDTKSIEGLISYIKFRDKTAVNAVLKSQRRSDTLLDSKSYLNLRRSLNESKYAEKIRVLWNNNEVSLYYDARDEECMEMHFYKELFEGDLDNEIKRFNRFR